MRAAMLLDWQSSERAQSRSGQAQSGQAEVASVGDQSPAYVPNDQALPSASAIENPCEP